MAEINKENMGRTPLSMSLGIPGFEYGDLYDPDRLADLSRVFDDYLEESEPVLFSEFLSYRESPGAGIAPEVVSDILVRVASFVGNFIARLFKLESECDAQRQSIRDEVDTVFEYRGQIVAKLKRHFKGADCSTWDQNAIVERVELLKRIAFPETATDDPERAIARVAVKLLHLNDQLQAGTESGGKEYVDADE
jgi:hypothetical protein